MPWGQKKRTREMIHSQMVTPPLAAMDGTTLRLKTATTKRRTRSHRPRTRRRWGASGARVTEGAVMTSFDNLALLGWPGLRDGTALECAVRFALDGKSRRAAKTAPCATASLPALLGLVAGGTCYGGAALLLGFGQRGSDFFKHGKVFVDVRFRVLDRDGPLLVPPIWLCEDAAIDHGEPIVAPEVDVDGGPVAIVLDFLGIEHQRAVYARAGDVSLQADLGNDFAIALGEALAQLVGVRVVLAGEHFAERRETRGHGNAIGVVGATVENLMLRDQVHHRAAGSKCGERQAAADGFSQTDHVGLYAEVFAGAAPAKLCAGFYFIEDEQGAIFCGDITEALQEAGLRHAQAHVHENGLENNRGDLTGTFAEAPLDAAEIVEAGYDNVGQSGFGDAAAARHGIGRVGIAVVFGLGLDADERGVMQSVVGAFKLQDFVAAGGGARDAASVHGHFGTAGTEANHLNRIALADFFGELPFLIVRHAEGGAFVQLLLNGFHHRGVAMSGHQCAKAQVVVNIFVAVEVVDAAPLAVFHEDRIWLVMAIVAGDSEGDALQGPFVSFRGLGRSLLVGGDFLL